MLKFAFGILALVVLCAATPITDSDSLPVVDESMIEQINSVQSNWTAGINTRFANLTIAEAKRLLGVLPGEGPFVPTIEAPEIDAAAIPAQFDARSNPAWSRCSPVISQIRDQSACGSCWAFGAASAMSDRLCIATGGAVSVPLSTEDILSCCTNCGQGCGGGYPQSAWMYFQSAGLVAEAAYPYALPPCEHAHAKGPRPSCGAEYPTPRCDQSKLSGKKYFGASTYRVSGVAAIQNEIMTNGPVEALFDCYADFLSYRSGVYRHTSGGSLGGHAVRILGWGVENGAAYWLASNSWNTDWGDRGLFKILRGTNECGIEAQMVTGKVKTPV